MMIIFYIKYFLYNRKLSKFAAYKKYKESAGTLGGKSAGFIIGCLVHILITTLR